METFYDNIFFLDIGKSIIEKDKIYSKLKSTDLEYVRLKIYNIINESTNDIDGYIYNYSSDISQDLSNFIFDTIINSINTESGIVRLSLKFDNKVNDIIIGISDNGKGINALNNNKSFTSLGGNGILIKGLKILSNNRTKLLRSDKGASIVSKINLNIFSDKKTINKYKIPLLIGKINYYKKNINLKLFFISSLFKMLKRVYSKGLNEGEIKKIMDDFMENKLLTFSSKEEFNDFLKKV